MKGSDISGARRPSDGNRELCSSGVVVADVGIEEGWIGSGWLLLVPGREVRNGNGCQIIR
jgi:hypothetical protein